LLFGSCLLVGDLADLVGVELSGAVSVLDKYRMLVFFDSVLIRGRVGDYASVSFSSALICIVENFS